VGPTSAAILATVEPLVTVLLASLVFGETLGVLQLAGGALVLASVPVLHARRVARREPALELV
jgi:drug/metabolite transporter (DMT)-like permease